MKNKFFKKQVDLDLEDDELPRGASVKEADLDNGGPTIAAVKQNKLLIIIASAVLITVVIYFLFFKDDNKPKEQLVEQLPTSNRSEQVVASEGGKSPFELPKAEEKQKDKIDLLEKPKTPDVPKLPELPKDDQAVSLIEPEKVEPVKEEPALLDKVLPTQKKEESKTEAVPTPAVAEPVFQPTGDLTDPKYAPIIMLSGGNGPARSVGYDNNIVTVGGDAIQKLDKSQVTVKTTFIANRSNIIAQGKLITAVLETAINTEIPGSVRAVVSRDVYGEAGTEILIARGSRLYGSYSSEVSRGQGRVQINWTRLIRPDGVDLAISSFASDQFGRSGIEGDVNNKYGSVIANSLLTSILAVAGVAAAEKIIGTDGSTSTTNNASQGSVTTTGNASTQAVYNVSKTITDTVTKIVNDNLSVNPVIRVPQGTRVNVIVNADMDIPSMKKR